jgi:hypothetical protein
MLVKFDKNALMQIYVGQIVDVVELKAEGELR